VRKINSFIVLLIILYSCSGDNNIEILNGYWEIQSVKKGGTLIKKYPFSNTVDFFYIKDLEGYRKKVTPRSDGRFMVTLHQANLNVTKENGEFILRYLNKSKTYFEKIKKIDSQQLIILDKEGYIYKYNRYIPIEINKDGE
jgi:transcriptional regulator with PAS, ATPase and Fis domain